MNQRGVRENQLLQNIRKNLEICQDAAKKPIPEYLELEEPENIEDVKMLPYGCAAPDEPGTILFMKKHLAFLCLNILRSFIGPSKITQVANHRKQLFGY